MQDQAVGTEFLMHFLCDLNDLIPQIFKCRNAICHVVVSLLRFLRVFLRALWWCRYIRVTVDRRDKLNQYDLIAEGWVRLQELLVSFQLSDKSGKMSKCVNRTNNDRLIFIGIGGALRLLQRVDTIRALTRRNIALCADPTLTLGICDSLSLLGAKPVLEMTCYIS